MNNIGLSQNSVKANLHVHSDYSTRDSIQNVKKIAEFNRINGLVSEKTGKKVFCITDHGNMSCHPEAFQYAIKNDMTFLPGCEVYLQPEEKFDGKISIGKMTEIVKELKKKTLTDEERMKYEKEKEVLTSHPLWQTSYFHLVLLAYNFTGLMNLYKINNDPRNSFYYKHRVCREAIFENSEGLICLTACPASEFLSLIEHDRVDEAEAWLKEWKEHFKDKLYFELQYHDGVYSVDRPFEYVDLEVYESLPEEYRGYYYNKGYYFVDDHSEFPIPNPYKLPGVKFLKYSISYNDWVKMRKEKEKLVETTGLQIAKKLGVKVIATNDAHYSEPKDRKYWEITRKAFLSGNPDLTGNYHMMNDNSFFEEVYSSNLITKAELDQNEQELINLVEDMDIPASPFNSSRADVEKFEQYVWTGFKKKREDVVEEKKKDLEEYLNTGIVQEKWLKNNKIKYDLEEDIELTDEQENMYKKYLENQIVEAENFKERSLMQLCYELAVIESKGFPLYFLTMRDLIESAKNIGCLTGPGRGSGAGSEVTYCMDITATDPLKFGLMFERFLNPNRTSMPDIDTDFNSQVCSNFAQDEFFENKFNSTKQELVSWDYIRSKWEEYKTIKSRNNDNRRYEIFEQTQDWTEYFESPIIDVKDGIFTNFRCNDSCHVLT